MRLKASSSLAVTTICVAAVLLRLAVGLSSYSGCRCVSKAQHFGLSISDPPWQAVIEWPGAGKAPLFGDFEAQRHWMEITLHTGVSDWYQDSKVNDLGYWGLDYPPLTAYQSWLYGKAIAQVVPEAVALTSSRGFESSFSKLLMRWSVVISDILELHPLSKVEGSVTACARDQPHPQAYRSSFSNSLLIDSKLPKLHALQQCRIYPGCLTVHVGSLAVLIPGIVACAYVFGRRSLATRPLILASALLQPALVLIDHGHFQYNGLSLGLTAGAAAAVGAGRHVLGSVLYCLALNHKQMSMYHAPAFFAHLLGCCLQHPSHLRKALAIAKLGIAVTATFAVIWAPFLAVPGAPGAVLARLVPLRRGLFEDYVANFWCATSLAIKWKRLLSLAAQVRLCTVVTLAAAAPSIAHQVMQPSPQGLLYGMANSAFAFFLFSFQVHEKSILLVLLPVTLLAAAHPKLAIWLPCVGTFSMWPLLRKDGLVLPYAACLMLWAALACLMDLPQGCTNGDHAGAEGKSSDLSQRTSQESKSFGNSGQGPDVNSRTEDGRGARGSAVSLNRICEAGAGLSVLAALVIHAWQAAVLPPKRLPFFFDALVIELSFIHLFASAVYMNYHQWAVHEQSVRHTVE